MGKKWVMRVMCFRIAQPHTEYCDGILALISTHLHGIPSTSPIPSYCDVSPSTLVITIVNGVAKIRNHAISAVA